MQIRAILCTGDHGFDVVGEIVKTILHRARHRTSRYWKLIRSRRLNVLDNDPLLLTASRAAGRLVRFSSTTDLIANVRGHREPRSGVSNRLYGAQIPLSDSICRYAQGCRDGRNGHAVNKAKIEYYSPLVNSARALVRPWCDVFDALVPSCYGHAPHAPSSSIRSAVP